MNFFTTIKSEHNINLDLEQKAAASHINGPALILAGPGSGKTTVITARAAYLIKEIGVKPFNILTLTFNKAAQLEMERRFNRLYGSEIPEKVHFATLHSFCNRVIRDYERMKGKRLRRIEGNDQEISKHHLLREIYSNINNSKINDDELENLINEIGLVKNKLIRDFDGMTFSTKRFLQIYKEYENYKKSNLLIDFDDMLTYAYSILTRSPELLSHYRNRYSYIQVDEGQDLSKIQFEIIKLLAAENNNLFIVADDDQSIYSFRGAEPKYILDFEKQYKNCRIFRLENNYRSTGNIVGLSSSFIRQNKKRYDKNHVTRNHKLRDPEIIKTIDQREQLKFIMDKLNPQFTSGGNSRRTESDCTEKVGEKKLAVLYRNNLSSILIADMLDRTKTSFKIRQNKLYFFRHWLVQEVTAFLLFALDPQDVEAFSKIYYRMNRYISKAMLECALAGNCGKPVIDCIMNGMDLKPFQINGLQELKLEFANLAKKRPWSALEYIKNNFNYLDSIKEYCEIVGLSYEYLYRLFVILQEIASFCGTLVEFLERLSELDNLFEGNTSTEYESREPQITLSTLHSSKGLEYDCVFMIDLTNCEIPGDKALEKALELKDFSLLEEERRLFYVGMTRAKEELYLLFWDQQDSNKIMASTFVKEVSQLLNNEVVSGLGEGVVVRHAKFGMGVVISVDNAAGTSSSSTFSQFSPTIEIKFLNGLVKRLDLKICLESKLLSME